MNTVAVILASGSGQRFGADAISKHLTPILEVPIFVWTLHTALRSSIFKSLVVVTRKSDIFEGKKLIQEYFPEDYGTIQVTEGSNARMNSFLCGLNVLKKEDLISKDTIVALFDANRPFTKSSQLHDLYESAKKYHCSCPARPVVNGVARIVAGHILEVADKSRFFEFVTPEFIRYEILEATLEKTSYDCFVEYALAVGVKPATVEASSLNSKLTYPEDKAYLEGLALECQLVRPQKSIPLKLNLNS